MDGMNMREWYGDFSDQWLIEAIDRKVRMVEEFKEDLARLEADIEAIGQILTERALATH